MLNLDLNLSLGSEVCVPRDTRRTPLPDSQADDASECGRDVSVPIARCASYGRVGLVSVAGFQAAGDQPLLGSLLVRSHWR